MSRRVLLIILDGWGLAPAGPANAISLANTPNFEYFWTKYPHTRLFASGIQVGLPRNQMGNSEVGHLNIGAGRVVTQDLPRITQSIENKTFFNNSALKSVFSYAKKQKKPIHLMGLLSDGGVHSHESHLYALLEMAKKEKSKDVFIHIFTDGRDVGPKTALKYIDNLENKIKQIGIGRIVSISGRYYAMDRDKRWERTSLAYKSLINECRKKTDVKTVIRESYKKGLTDEFIKPTILDANGQIKDGDAVIFFNLRSDRPRQLSEALINQKFSGFKRDKVLKKLYFVTMTEYEKELPVNDIAFPENIINKCLAETVSSHGLRQFHIAETEKYAHVTYFFNGGREKPFFGESRHLIPSPKVATYDEEPVMSAIAISDSLSRIIGEYDFIVVNYANLDMVGHTGNIPATISACETVDECLGGVVEKAVANDYEVIITADHGNAEKMLDEEGRPVTSHTTNRVPFVLISEDDFRLKDLKDAKLGNIAPTVIDLMQMEKPKEMLELSLLKH